MAIVTLTSDFGESDHFAGVMKGVILGIAPRVQLVDITHQVSPFEVLEGAFVIAQAYRYFPKGTVHVVVVDPGVGTGRRPILVEAAGQFFIGPDNGVLNMVYGREKARVRHISNAKYFLKNVSETFHGRDVFAPAAGHVAKGVRPSAMGPVIDDYLRSNLDKPSRIGKRHWAGAVLKVDRFGNLITNFHVDEFPGVRSRPIVLMPGVRALERIVSNYAEAPFGEPVIIIGSSGYLEVIVNQGNAGRILGCGAGSPVELTIL
jgi:hypothetical protein